MARWTKWVDIDLAKSKNGPFYKKLGIYQISIVKESGRSIHIPRFVGTDKDGIIYIGRSGFNENRSIANRIREFINQRHSGGITYSQTKRSLDRLPKFSNRILRVRAKYLNISDITFAEAKIINKYFEEHAELPPCNSIKPKL